MNPWKHLVLTRRVLEKAQQELAEQRNVVASLQARIEELVVLTGQNEPTRQAPPPPDFNNAVIEEERRRKLGESACIICGAPKEAHTDFSPEGIPGHQIRMPGACNDGVWHAFQQRF